MQGLKSATGQSFKFGPYQSLSLASRRTELGLLTAKLTFPLAEAQTQ
jgi:hypothetical protein